MAAATGSKRSGRLFEAVFVLAFPLLVVGALLWLNRPAEIINAQVIESTVETTDTGVVGNVIWSDANGVRHNRRVDMTPEHVTSGTVPFVISEGELVVVDPAEYGRVSPAVLVTAALIAVAFAVVVVATMRGYGFVRGTGRSGEMTQDELQESHGFYWRH